MIQRASLIAVPVLALLAFSVVRWWRTPTASARAQVLGAIFAWIVILAHIAEAFNVWPSMGWGQPHSIGHYTDLASGLFSVILLAMAAVLAMRSRTAPDERRRVTERTGDRT